LFGVTLTVSLAGAGATAAVDDDAADFFGRPRFLAEPSALAVALGFGAGFFNSSRS